MQIAYILEKFPSPTEYFILNEILEFEKKGVEIVLFVLKRQKQYENLPEVKMLKANIFYLPRLHFYFPIIPVLLSPFSFIHFSFFSVDSSLIGLLKSLRYYGVALCFARKKANIDHIHAHFAFIALDIALYLSRILKVNYSFTAHAQDIYTNQEKIKQHLPLTRFLITCTEYNRNYLNKITKNIYTDKIYKVYHGVFIDKWTLKSISRTSNKEVFILTVARLVEKKGIIYLIKAIEKILETGINIHCTIIGEGGLKATLDKYIKTHKLQKCIEILQFVSQPELKTFYSRADVFVLPCIVCNDGDRDGLPNVIIEAMLSGIPVVSTTVSAIPEVIKHEETGILVKEKDEQAIMNGINVLIDNYNLRKQIVKNARRLIENKLDIQLSTNELFEIFTQYLF